MPPAMARSFSKCSSSFWLAKFVWNSVAVARQNSPSADRAKARQQSQADGKSRSELQRDGGQDQGKADAERGHGLHRACRNAGASTAPS